MPAWKAALYFVEGLSDHVWLKGHFRLVKEDRVEVENIDNENKQNDKRMRRNNCFWLLNMQISGILVVIA